MEYPVKICPRCKVRLQQADSAFQLASKGAGSSDGLPVIVYSCPKCGYIELYNLEIIGHI